MSAGGPPLPSRVDAAKITRQSKSNLALAFVSLGRERRQDITTFYAFCRLIDDIAFPPRSVPRKSARAWLPGATGYASGNRAKLRWRLKSGRF